MRYLLGGLLILTTLPALADGQAVIESGTGQDRAEMEVHWADDRLRMDFPNQAQAGYMLLTDGKGYMVSQMQGQTIVMDMAQLKSMADSIAADPETESVIASQQASEVEALEKTGETETVAGVEGDVYTMQWTDKAGGSHESELVLTDDPQVLELSSGFDAYQQSISGEPDVIATTLEERGLGLLRFGDRFRLVSLSTEQPEAELFKLPEDAQTFEDLMRSAMSE